MPYPTYVSRPKKADKKDRISIDGTDYSNAFREFGVSSSKSTEDAGGFNPTGVVETVPGATTQSFTGTLYNIADVVDALWDIHIADEVVLINWQPGGLESGHENDDVFYGMMTIQEMSPQSTFGTVTSFAFSAITADSDGIRLAAGT